MAKKKNATAEEKLAKVVELLDKIPAFSNRPEDWYVYDGCGGNVDDAYGMGEESGREDLADDIRRILDIGAKLPSRWSAEDEEEEK